MRREEIPPRLKINVTNRGHLSWELWNIFDARSMSSKR